MSPTRSLLSVFMSVTTVSVIFAAVPTSARADSLYVKSAGVGINTSSPGYDLDVSGTLRATGTVRANSSLIVSSTLEVANTTTCNSGAYLATNGSGDVYCSSAEGISGSGGSNQVCFTGSNKFAYCSSSIQYKKDVQDYAGGMDVINKLRPVSFHWKDESLGKRTEVGLIAEEVEKVDPRFVSYINDDKINGVKYDKFVAVLVNALKEQQTEISALKEQMKTMGTLEKRVNAIGEAVQKQQPGQLSVALAAQ